MPFRVTKIPTESTDDWMSVSADPVGVQTLPTADVQSAGEPVPGATLCRFEDDGSAWRIKGGKTLDD